MASWFPFKSPHFYFTFDKVVWYCILRLNLRSTWTSLVNLAQATFLLLLLLIDIQLLSTIGGKNYPFSIELILLPCPKSVGHTRMDYFWVIFSFPLIFPSANTTQF